MKNTWRGKYFQVPDCVSAELLAEAREIGTTGASLVVHTGQEPLCCTSTVTLLYLCCTSDVPLLPLCWTLEPPALCVIGCGAVTIPRGIVLYTVVVVVVVCFESLHPNRGTIMCPTSSQEH